MCKAMKFDGETFHTVAQLAKKVGIDQLVWHRGLSPDQMNEDLDYCLCGVDVASTAKRLGKVAVEFDLDPICQEFVAAPNVEPEVRRPALQPQLRHAS